MSRRLYEIDALRGIAAVSVVLFHYLTKYNHQQNIIIDFSHGGLGVNLFFMISGFVIYMSLSNANSLKVFVQNRLIRLYPAYWSAIFITSCVLYMVGEAVDPSKLIANLSMLQYWMRVDNIDGVYWTLRVELTFYILIATLYFFRIMGVVHRVVILWLFIQILIKVLMLQTGVDPTIYFTLRVLNSLFILDFSHLFIAGIMLYHIYIGKQEAKSWLVLALSCLVSYIIDSNVHFFAFLLFNIIFFMIVKNKIGILRNKFLLFFGGISYSLYLIHQVVGYKLMDFLYVYIDNSAFVIVATFGFIVLISYLNRIFFEVWISKKIHKKLSNYD
jgi:peptidoglycan/LPS O-acetylase OafA/YrhL